jgi:predicted dienelactone hydrolase
MIRMTNYQGFSRRRVLGAGLMASLLLSTPALAQAYPVEPAGSRAAAPEVKPQTIDLPAPTGRYAIGTTELHLVDPARNDPTAPGGKRELMVSLWYPARQASHGPAANYMPAKAAIALDKSLKLSYGIASPVGTIDLANSRTHGQVDVPVRPGKHPVVLVSPGYAYSRFLQTAQVEELASQGYIVVTMDHTHEAPVEFPGGRLVPGVANTSPGPDVYAAAIATRTADARFVLDQVWRMALGANPDAEERDLPSGLRAAIDWRRIGIYGFSAGGFTSAAAMYADRRFVAGADLDGTLSYDKDDSTLFSEVAKKGLDRPFLLFGSDGSQRTKPAGDPDGEQSWASFWQAQQGWKLNLQLPGARHPAFSDFQFIYYDVVSKLLPDDETGLAEQVQQNVSGLVEHKRSVLAQRAYLTAYFDLTLRRQPQALLEQESGDFPEVRFVR